MKKHITEDLKNTLSIHLLVEEYLEQEHPSTSSG